jgi:hypothetical protein
MFKLAVLNFLFISNSIFPLAILSFSAKAEPILQAYGNSFSVCATRSEVIIRDFYTLEPTGELNQGECMEVVDNVQHSDPTVRAQYITVRGGQSGKLRLISKQFVVFAGERSTAPPQAYDNNQVSVCSTRPGVLIRDFYTLEPRGELNQGECMEVVSNIQHSDPNIRAQYITVKGGQSGKLRLISKQFVIFR